MAVKRLAPDGPPQPEASESRLEYSRANEERKTRARRSGKYDDCNRRSTMFRRRRRSQRRSISGRIDVLLARSMVVVAAVFRLIFCLRFGRATKNLLSCLRLLRRRCFRVWAIHYRASKRIARPCRPSVCGSDLSTSRSPYSATELRSNDVWLCRRVYTRIATNSSSAPRRKNAVTAEGCKETVFHLWEIRPLTFDFL